MTILREELERAMANVPKKWSQPLPSPRMTEQQSRDMLHREVHHQLWAALCSMAALHYELAGKIGMSPQTGYDQELMIGTIHCLNKNPSTLEYKRISEKLAPLLDDLETVGEDGYVRIMSSQGVGLAMIEYDTEDLYDALVLLLGTQFPDDHVSFSHLNAIWHIEERLGYGPKHSLS